MSCSLRLTPVQRADWVRGVLFALGMGGPVIVGMLTGQLPGGAFAALGAMLALSLDPRRRALARIPAIVLGVLLVIAAAALGLQLAGQRELAWFALFAVSWLAGQPRPEHAYLGLLGKYAASALVLAEMGFPATLALALAYFSGAMFGLALSLLQAWLVKSSEPGSAPWAEMEAVLAGDTNGPLFGLALPLTILLASLSARQLGAVEPGWVGLTVLFVMHVDDAQAWRRIRQRIAGTLLGVLLAWLLLLLTTSPLLLAWLIMLFAAFYPYTLRSNYLHFSLIVTTLVLLVIDVARLASGGDLGLLGWRFYDSLLGCCWVAVSLVILRALRRWWPGRR